MQSTYSPSGCNALDLIRHWPCLLKQASNVLGICVNLIYVLLTRHQFPPLSRGAKPVVEKSGTPGIVEYGSYVRVQGHQTPPGQGEAAGVAGCVARVLTTSTGVVRTGIASAVSPKRLFGGPSSGRLWDPGNSRLRGPGYRRLEKEFGIYRPITLSTLLDLSICKSFLACYPLLAHNLIHLSSERLNIGNAFGNC